MKPEIEIMKIRSFVKTPLKWIHCCSYGETNNNNKIAVTTVVSHFMITCLTIGGSRLGSGVVHWIPLILYGIQNSSTSYFWWQVILF